MENNKKKKITIAVAVAALVAVIAIGITLVNSPRGTYYEINDTSEYVKIAGGTITESYTGDSFTYEKSGNTLDVMYDGFSIKTFTIEEYEGYDCLFEDGEEVPTYCKSKEGAEKVKKAMDDAKQAEIDNEIKAIADGQKEVFNTLDGTNWERNLDDDYYYGTDHQGSITMKDGNITIELKQVLSEYEEEEGTVPSTLVLKGKYEYNDATAKSVYDFTERDDDIKIIPESFVLDNKERSLEDVSAYIQLYKDSDEEYATSFLKRAFFLTLNIPQYPEDGQVFSGEIGCDYIKK